MKRSFSSVLGVTLLEIMLVLAIAAMIVVMSIRYYQSASNNQKVAQVLDSITGLVAAGESIFNAGNSLSAATSANVAAYMPGGKLPVSPWSASKYTVTGSAATMDITVPSVPTAACAQLKILVKTNIKLTGGDCTGTDFKVTFNPAL